MKSGLLRPMSPLLAPICTWSYEGWDASHVGWDRPILTGQIGRPTCGGSVGIVLPKFTNRYRTRGVTNAPTPIYAQHS